MADPTSPGPGTQRTSHRIRPPRLYAIADATALGSENVPEAVANMARSGVGWIQLRAKNLSGIAFHRLVEDSLARLGNQTVHLWIDDRADIAAMFPVAGVHVGQEDLPPVAARKVVGAGVLIGHSTHNDAQVAAAEADDNVDVVALGPIFETRSKERPDPVVGLEGLQRARRLTGKPLVAIGGINGQNLTQVLASGADSVAVLGALCRGNVLRNCEQLLALAEEAR